MLFEKLCVYISWDIASVDLEALTEYMECHRYRMESVEAVEGSGERGATTLAMLTMDRTSAARVCRRFGYVLYAFRG